MTEVWPIYHPRAQAISAAIEEMMALAYQPSVWCRTKASSGWWSRWRRSTSCLDTDILLRLSSPTCTSVSMWRWVKPSLRRASSITDDRWVVSWQCARCCPADPDRTLDRWKIKQTLCHAACAQSRGSGHVWLYNHICSIAFVDLLHALCMLHLNALNHCKESADTGPLSADTDCVVWQSADTDTDYRQIGR